jgi:hypothetical protein
MRGDALAQLNVLTSMSNVQEGEPRVGHQVYRRTPSQRAVGQISWATDASIAHPIDVVPTSVAPSSATRPRAFKL